MGTNSRAMAKYLRVTAAFLQQKEESGVTPRTLRNYASRLNSLYEFMANTPEYNESGPTFQALMAYKTYQLHNGVSVSSLRQYLVELQTFFSWASDPHLQEGYPENPITRRMIPTIRGASKKPYGNLLTQEDIILLLRQNRVKGCCRPQNWERNYAIVVMLLTTGIRNAELLDLTPRDLDYEEGYLTVREGKGGKSRTIQFPSLAQAAVRAYIQSGRRPKWAGENDVIFGTDADENGLTTYGKVWHRGTQAWLSRIVERYVRVVTGREGIRSHSLRHACAKTLLEEGMTLEEIQVVLGHESITTTQIYAGRLSPEKAGDKARAIFEEMEYQARRAELRVV